MKITLLGTGSPEASTRRASSGYLVETGGDVILMDCGGGVFDRLLQANLRPSDVTHLFFTHLHSDHMMDYARLVHAAWDEGGAPLKVYGPAPIANITDKLFGDDGVFATDLIARTDNACSQDVWVARGGTLPRPWPSPVVTEWVPGASFISNNWSLTSCEVIHAQPQLDSMAFRLKADGKSFVYSADAAESQSFELFAQGCDLLLHWCYREENDISMPAVAKLSPDAVQIARLATRCEAKQLVLTHLRNKMDSPEAHAKIIDAVKQHYALEFCIAEDLMEFELGIA